MNTTIIVPNTKINKKFSHIKSSEKKITNWIIKKYFDPRLNKESTWYSPDVSEQNVLAYISNPKNKFPLTPYQTVDLWNTIESFKKNLKKSEEVLGQNLGLPENTSLITEQEQPEIAEKITAKYQLGDTTYKDIGAVLGGLSHTMINKLAISGMEKIKDLTLGISLEEISEKKLKNINQKISDARLEVAIDFAKNLKLYVGQPKDFINFLLQKRIITKNDINLIANEEVELLTMLASKSHEEIIMALINDIAKQNNIIKSFQSAVSKKVFPERKRGRPRKLNSFNGEIIIS